MPSPSRSRASLLLFALAVLPLSASATPAQSLPPGAGALPCHATPSAPLPRCLEDLTRMSWDELEQLYLGLMFRRRSYPQYKTFFALEVCTPAAPSDLLR